MSTLQELQELQERRQHLQELRQCYEHSIESFEREVPPEERTPLQNAQIDSMKRDIDDLYHEESMLKEQIKESRRQNQKEETREYETDRIR